MERGTGEDWEWAGEMLGMPGDPWEEMGVSGGGVGWECCAGTAGGLYWVNPV